MRVELCLVCSRRLHVLHSRDVGVVLVTFYARYALEHARVFALVSSANMPRAVPLPANMSRSVAAHDDTCITGDVPSLPTPIIRVALSCTNRTHCSASCLVAHAGYTMNWPDRAGRLPRWCRWLSRTAPPVAVWPYIRMSAGP